MSVTDFSVGGQAVIEGVMMRSPSKVSISVRRPSGEVVTRTEHYLSLTKRYRLLGWPVIRGVVSFFEMLVIGIRTLNFSAMMAQDKHISEVLEEGKIPRAGMTVVFAMLLALILGLALFFAFPLFLVNLLGASRHALGFNLLVGLVRVLLFIGYLLLISRFREVQRVFAYHGAEHKSIYAFENADALTAENAARYSTLHPRCGTSFVLIVVLLAVFVFSISDGLFGLLVGNAPNLWQRLLLHLILLPVVAGLSYELLKFSARKKGVGFTKLLVAPGLWLQKITTREPDHQQLEVAITALKDSIAGTELASRALRS